MEQLITELQRRVGNRAVAAALSTPAPAQLPGVPAQLPRGTSVQRVVTYEPGESEIATDRGVISPDVRLLGGTGSGYNASGDSILLADFRPSSAVVRTSAAAELRGSWTRIIEGGSSLPYALLGFTDATGPEASNAQLRADRARSVARVLPSTARRAVIGAAPSGDFIMPGNATREQRALNRSVLVRLPPDELRQEGQVDRYAGEAVTYWRSNPDKTVTELLDFVSGRAGAQLERNGVPPPDVVPGRAAQGTGTLAFFSAEDWQITVDATGLASASPQTGLTATSRLSTLSVDAVADLAQACYHEARHAEQAFLAARLTAEESGSSLDARLLSRRLGIRVDIAEQAITASARVLPDVLKPKAAAWRTFMLGGRHLPYRQWNEGLKDYLAIFTFVFGPKMDEFVAKGAGDIQVLWQHGLHPPINDKLRHRYFYRGDDLRLKLTKDPHHDPVDEDVRKTLTNTLGTLFIALAKEGQGAKLPTSADVRKMSADDAKLADLTAQVWIIELKLALIDARAAADAAYRAYPQEADAYEVGAAVTASVKAQAAGP